MLRTALVCCCTLIFGCSSDTSENKSTANTSVTPPICAYCQANQFRAIDYQKLHILSQQDQAPAFKLTAHELRKRQRQGRLVNFIDHDELYAKNLTIFQPLKNHIAELDTNEIGIDPSSSSTSSGAGLA